MISSRTTPSTRRFGTLTLLAALPLAALATPGRAQVTTYTDRAAFTSAASGLTTIDFNDQKTPGASSTTFPNGTVTLQGVTFTGNGGLDAVGADFDNSYDLGDDYVLTFQGARSGVELLSIALPTGTTAFGLDFGSFTGSAFTFTLSTGDSFTFDSSVTPTTTPTFFGITTAAPVTSLTIDAGAAVAPMIDRFSFGTQATASAAPEPGTIAFLLTAGVPVAGLVRRRRK